ncbi:protein HAPLESS 2 isoform X1 [Ananas comosus]|uniref:Protein HAPLESS 2 isoform X1 n=1 Tax=Ananas comosus TaxID=4615 RepID=A0A6P5H1J1_ANACO|nr:protein HAPLESS 2 isoform X1 [Ananas comosus]
MKGLGRARRGTTTVTSSHDRAPFFRAQTPQTPPPLPRSSTHYCALPSPAPQMPPLAPLSFFLLRLLLLVLSSLPSPLAVEILAKSRLETCAKVSGSDDLTCGRKIVVDMAVPSGSSGGEASIVAELVEVEENDTQKMQTIRSPPVITINKSAAYALYELMYIRDVSYKPEEFYVKTHKCEPDASAKVVEICERLRDQNGHIIEHTQPICCPCGPQRRVPSSCGNFFDKLVKGKANTAHCLRFPGDWFHVFGIGRRSLGFSVKIQVKKGSSLSEVVVGPENRTVLSSDNFLRVNLIGDFVGYTSIPSFEDFYLVTPRSGTAGQPQELGRNFSKWMLLERVRFTLDGLECNKIGVGYEAYRGQPNFCSSPLWSCLHNQLWHFWEADQNRISRNQPPQYVVEGRFERINQHPSAGSHSFSVGITEVLNTNLLIELSADDIEYVYQRSPGKIISINIPTFEALTQFGTATIMTKNIGKLEASYSLTFDCMRGVSYVEEQFFIMKPDEVVSRSFYLYPTTDQAAKYRCAAILKASDFTEVDRAECQFTTTATILDNGSQIVPADEPKKNGIHAFFEAIKGMWNTMWDGVIDFFTGKACRSKCASFFDFSCHMHYVCMNWILMFGLLLAILPTVIVLLWLLHQKGFFDPLYDWLEDRFGTKYRHDRKYSKRKRALKHSHHHGDGHRKHHKGTSHTLKRGKNTHHVLHKHDHFEPDRHLRHENALRVHKEGHKHRHSTASSRMQQRERLSRHGTFLREIEVMEHETSKQHNKKKIGHKHSHD